MFDKTLLITAALLTTSAANATLIDFTDHAVWGTSGSGAVTKNYDGLNVTLQAFDASGSTAYTNTGFDGDNTVCGGLVCQSDGIGIQDDELSFGTGPLQYLERLTITFDRAVDVDTIWMLDLSAAVRSDAAGAEVFHVLTNGETWGSWTGTDTGSSGLFAAALNNATVLSDTSIFSNVWSLDFFVTDFGDFSAPANSDFALAGIDVSVSLPESETLSLSSLGGAVYVPEPGTLSLLSLGLLGVFGARRRLAKRA